MYFDPMYFVFLAPALALSLYASFKTRSAFNKWSKVRAASGRTGAQAAQAMLDAAGLSGEVKIVSTHGMLSDHYNPVTKTLALSEAVYHQPSIAAIGVACHEAGHAIQHAQHYAPLWVRSALVPTANIGSMFGYMGMVVGLMIASQQLFMIGVGLFSLVIAFQVVTLPVEFDASNRAKKLSVEHGIILPQERAGVDQVLNAAALTYIAAAISSLMTLLYFLMRAGLLGRRDD